MSTFSKQDFYKHAGKYRKEVINKILNGNDIKLGKIGNTDIKIQPLNINESCTYEEFNSILYSHFKIKWTDIFKGDFSGYVNGLSSKNKGFAFEDDFINNYKNYEIIIKDTLHQDFGRVKELQHTGTANTSRKMTCNGSGFYIGNPNKNFESIGNLISDVTLLTENNKINYSLKYSPTVTFCNIGIQRLFPSTAFNNDNTLNEITYNNISNIKFLDFLCIDKSKFVNVFLSYKNKNTKKSAKEIVDITNQIKSNKLFHDFIYSAVGAGYIMVHQINEDIHIYDLRTENDMKKFIGNFKKASILYPIDGGAKRIDIKVCYTGIDFNINIRNKQGGLFPSHLMIDYKIKI